MVSIFHVICFMTHTNVFTSQIFDEFADAPDDTVVFMSVRPFDIGARFPVSVQTTVGKLKKSIRYDEAIRRTRTGKADLRATATICHYNIMQVIFFMHVYDDLLLKHYAGDLDARHLRHREQWRTSVE